MYIDYYKTLEIAESATTEEIKKSFRKLAHKYHPDKNTHDENANRKFAEIYQAYKTLIDPQKRKAYDQYGNAKQFEQAEQQQWEEDRYQEQAAAFWETDEYQKMKSRAETWEFVNMFIMAISIIATFISIAGPILNNHRINEEYELSEIKHRKAQNTIDSIKNLLTTFGPVYLYTNDSGATAKLAPDIKGAAFELQEDRQTFNESFLQKPDSIGVISIITASDNQSYQLSESVLNEGIGKLKIQFMFYDLIDEMPHKTVKLRDTTIDLSMDNKYGTRYDINFDNKSQLKESMKGFTPFFLFRKYRNLKVYMTAKASRDKTMQVDLPTFKCAINMVNKRLHQSNIDTNAFKLNLIAPLDQENIKQVE